MTHYIELLPSPASLIESLRSIGYSLEAAVADVIDNSIAAKARNIDIRFAWDSSFPWLAIIDDGCGMSQSELVTAMRLGSISPLATREKDDLGRFGLGLKTASFSQCRQLTVLSKQAGQLSCFQWDIDLIINDDNAGWRLVVFSEKEYRSHQKLKTLLEEYLDKVESGTIVLWEKLDRLNEPQTSQKGDQYFSALMFGVRTHLELIFHRFLSPDRRSRRLVIRMNNDELEAFNPFNPTNVATQELPEQTITVEGEKIRVQPYVLPHHNKVSTQEYKKYAGDDGYLHNQGFYIYRNQRLIIKGSWFRLIKKEELNKLIRVKVDIPNTLDHLWKLDVKKSYASPPESVRQALQQVISKIEVAGRNVYRQRGIKLGSGVSSPVWRRIATSGTVSYEINREHPLIADLLEQVNSEQRSQLQQMLQIIEYSFPRDLFFSDLAQNPQDVSAPTFADKEFEQLIDLFVGSLMASDNRETQLSERLLTIEPFASNRERTIKVLQRKGYSG